MSMQGKRQGVFLKRALVLVAVKEEFERIVGEVTGDGEVQQERGKQMGKEIGKQEIHTPRIGVVESLSRPKVPLLIGQMGYNRITAQKLSSLTPLTYQFTATDMTFIKHLKAKYSQLFLGRFKLKSKTFTDILLSCQQTYHKKKTIKLDDPGEQILGQLSFALPSYLSEELNVEQKGMLKLMLVEVVEYWKRVKVERRGFPMVREYWPKTDVAMERFNVVERVGVGVAGMSQAVCNNMWIPYKARIMQDLRKKSLYYQVRSLTTSEKQQKIIKFSREVGALMTKAKEQSQRYMNQLKEFNESVREFQSGALMVNERLQLSKLQPPAYLTDILSSRCQVGEKIGSLYDRYCTSSYFNNPVIKCISGGSVHPQGSDNHLRQSIQFNIWYNPQQKTVTSTNLSEVRLVSQKYKNKQISPTTTHKRSTSKRPQRGRQWMSSYMTQVKKVKIQ